MRSGAISLFLGEVEEQFQVAEDKSLNGTLLIQQDQKFIARIFKDTDGRWKSREVSDVAPAVLHAIGEKAEEELF
jgi:hypothetical protein